MTRLRLLITQLRQNYDGEYAPNVEACWDENDIEQNPEGWQEEVDRARKGLGADYENVALLTVEADDRFLYAAPAQPTPAQPRWLEVPAGQYGMRLIVGQRQDGAETWTEIVDVWDEYVLDENNEGFADKLAEESAKVGQEYAWLKIVDLTLPAAVVEQAIAPWRQAHLAILHAPQAAQG